MKRPLLAIAASCFASCTTLTGNAAEPELEGILGFEAGETDHEFDEGSGIDVESLSEQQVRDLAVLGRIWGFLKYHHSRVAQGDWHWDYELFRVLPEVLEADDAGERNRLIAQWIECLGVPDHCDPCAAPPHDVHLLPRHGWIGDTELLGSKLSWQLRQIHLYRIADGRQLYISLRPGVGNPVFDHELAYADMHAPDAGFRVLALFRLWNIIEYWFPYRDLINDWPAVLEEFLPRLVEAREGDSYRLEMLALITRIGDGHASLWSDLAVRPPLLTRIALPGGLMTAISGIGVFYPDKTPTQRVGIVPDIVARPTLEGIRDGRDEVLEAALRYILGPDADDAEIRRMALRP